ncbi:NTP transferase domain-containing protein [Aeromicrobium sp. UC242_57]|uniref:NTP transferase domain-containing protein n=1 Tax=Aeromicrobium sp. UC242_57 TaxID=3374624 RepID=UPI00378FC2C1
MSENVTAIVLAAGAGTRMKSSQAKVLHAIAGRSMIEHALVAVAGAGVARTIAVVGHDREQVEAAVSAHDPAVTLAVQEQRLGTGDAVRAALDSLDDIPDGPVLISYADVPLLSAQTLAAAHRRPPGRRPGSHDLDRRLDEPFGYGRILRDEAGAVTAIREHKDATEAERQIREVNSGILVVDGAFLARAVGQLSPQNAQGELYLTDIIGQAVDEGLPVGAHVLEDVWQTEGVNDRAQPPASAARSTVG